MEKELKMVSACFHVSEKDVRIIYDMIAALYNDHSYQQLIITLIKIFQSDIKPAHYVVLGHLIGYCLATDEMRDETNKSLSLCLRQN